MPYLISISIAIVNIIIKSVFDWISSFERYGLFSKEASSRIIKVFLVTFINTGLILLISNFKMNTNIIPLIG